MLPATETTRIQGRYFQRNLPSTMIEWSIKINNYNRRCIDTIMLPLRPRLEVAFMPEVILELL